MDQILKGRKFVFLQGPSSLFFAHVARACQRHGADVCRIGFVPGDWLYWPRRNARYIPFRGAPEQFFDFFESYLESDCPTDVLMLGDARFYHKCAIRALRESNARATPWIIEHGYLRPNLISVETWGHGGRSSIPEDWQRTEWSVGPDMANRNWAVSFMRYAMLDILYHLSNVGFGWIRYPRYQHYGLTHPLHEYSGWIVKGASLFRRRRIAESANARIAETVGNLFLFPLQLDGDFQLRDHGTGLTQLETLEEVIGSFSRNAQVADHLVVKTHPLDNGLRNWCRDIRRISEDFGVEDRIIFADAMDLQTILDNVRGVITINSTVGLTAVIQGFLVTSLVERFTTFRV